MLSKQRSNFVDDASNNLASHDADVRSFRFLSFTTGAILAVLISLTVYDEDVLNVEHMLTVMTGLGVLIGICRSLIPDEVRIIRTLN